MHYNAASDNIANLFSEFLKKESTNKSQMNYLNDKQQKKLTKNIQFERLLKVVRRDGRVEGQTRKVVCIEVFVSFEAEH